MNKKSQELIENNLIKNRCLVARLHRLVHRHSVSRNERLYGRDVDLVREWLASYPYREQDAQQQVAFTLRRDVRHWTRVALEWRGWEEFVGRMMEGAADGGIIKAFVLSCCYDYRHEFREITRYGRGKEQLWCDVRASEADEGQSEHREFLKFLYDNADRMSDAQLLMEVDLFGHEWTWDALAHLRDNPYRYRSLLLTVLGCKMDELLKVASPLAIARFSIFFKGDMDLRMGMAARVSQKMPTVYRDLYRQLVCGREREM